MVATTAVLIKSSNLTQDNALIMHPIQYNLTSEKTVRLVMRYVSWEYTASRQVAQYRPNNEKVMGILQGMQYSINVINLKSCDLFISRVYSSNIRY